MNNEFTKIKSGNYVRYVLEDGGSGGATSGATSVGSISSMDTPIGKDQIVVQSRMGPKEPPKPRNFVAKNAKMGGAGKMKDKSKTLPRHEKHKKPVAEGVNDLSYDAQSLITKLRRDVEEKRLQPTPQAVLAAARELAGDMEFAPQLLVQQVLGKGLAEGWKDKVGAAAMAGSMALGGGAAQASNWADAAARGLYYGATSKVAGSAIHKEKNAADMAFADKIPDEADRAYYLRAVKSIIRSRDDSVMRYAGHNGTISRGSITVDERKFNRIKTALSQKYNIPLDPVKEQGVAEGSLNELSKDTLKSYAKKAVPDMQASQNKSKAEYSKAALAKDDETANKHYDAAKQAKDRTEKRMAGVAGAIKRFNKEGVAEGSGGNKTHLAMAYLKAVMMAPTGTPENERIRNWQEELADEFDIEMDTAVLAQMLPQFDSMLQAGKLDKLQNRMASRGELEIGEAEEFNGEYDDEAGMAQSNLLTTARAVMGLLKTIKDRDNLPEWGQEKIAKAEMMLVSVWDYLQSQKEMGNDPQVEAYGRYDRRDAYQRDYDHSVAGMDRGNNHRDDERHDLDPSDWYIVKDGKMYKVSVYPNQEQEAMSRGYSPTRDEAKARAGEQGVAEGSYNDYLAGMLENVLGERSKSKAQWDLMHAVAHNPQFANQVKIKPSVGQEFSAADAGHERSALPDRVLKKNKK